MFAVPTERPLFRGRGLNNPADRANVPPNPIWPPNPTLRALAGPEPLWPPRPAYAANIPPNPIWPPNPTARALAGPEPLWPPLSAYGLNVPPNPVQPSDLENHSLASNLAWLSMEPPDKKTPSPPYPELKQDFRKIMDKLGELGYLISDSDTDSSS